MLKKAGLMSLLLLCVTSAQAQFVLTTPSDSLPTMTFNMATGLESQTQAVEAHDSSTPVFNAVKMPGLGQAGTISLLHATVANDNRFWDYYNSIEMNTIGRSTVIIQGPRGIVFTLYNAWPTSISTVSLANAGNQIVVNQMQIAYEQLGISYNTP